MKTRYVIGRSVLLAMLSATVALNACSKHTDTPPEIVVDKSACARCSMLISDGRFSAAVQHGDTYLVFDDIGCMLTYLREQGESASQKLWVRDYAHNTWIGAEHAEFYHADGDVTPMGYGYIAVQQATTKPPTGLTNLQRIGDIASLRADYHTRIQ